MTRATNRNKQLEETLSKYEIESKGPLVETGIQTEQVLESKGSLV